ncbi:MAG: dienelactone hydrolase family protein [Sphingomonadales bacterium]|nr:dienelactone hydrolase family protein [Sphingomonadales bacterium]
MTVLERVGYYDRDTALTGWLARPQGAARAAVLVWPTIANVTPAIERRAQMLADRGFLALIGDYYGEPVRDFDHARELAGVLRADTDNYRARLAAGLVALRALPGAGGLPEAVIGYCMGGQAALEVARTGADVRAVVSFHGVLDTGRRAEPDAVKARILICHGDADPLAPRDHVLSLWDELNTARAQWHFHSYSGVRHGFTDPGSDARGIPAIGYDASADRQSWAAMMSLFDEVFSKNRNWP